MLGNDDLLVNVLKAFNQHRKTEKIEESQIQALDREYALIRSVMEDLWDSEELSLHEKEEKLKTYLNEIKKDHSNDVKSKTLIHLTALVCQDVGINNSSSKTKPKK